LWRNPPYSGTNLDLALYLDDGVSVRASPEWLRRAFDILVDNSVKAVEGQQEQTITIGTRAGSRGVEIFIADTGPGMPAEVEARLGLDKIEKPEDAQGLGMGILMAQAITETFGGELRVAESNGDPTTMVVWLPAWASNDSERGTNHGT
jgi:signal transduction histidine kinase